MASKSKNSPFHTIGAPGILIYIIALLVLFDGFSFDKKPSKRK